MVEQVRRSYILHQFDKGNMAPGTTKPAASGFRPGKTVNMMPADIVTTDLDQSTTARRESTALLAAHIACKGTRADTPLGATIVKVDTMAQ
eukprot:6990533-Prymnesium_polylepis.1